jgi:restriction endonuclease S subunit
MSKFIKLGDACLVKRGTTITRKDTIEGKVPVVAGGRKATYYHNIHNRESDTITISGSGASAGFINYWSVPIFASDCSTVELKDNAQNIKFIYYFLQSVQEFIYKDLRFGAAQPHVYAKDIANLSYPVFSLKEQNNIVNKIDNIFIEIEKIKELEKIKIRKNISMAQIYLDNIFNSKNNLLKLSQCCKIRPSKSEINKLDNKTEVSFLPMRDMSINNMLVVPSQKRLLKDVRGGYTFFSDGDVLLAKITPCFENGKLGIASNLCNGIGFGSSEYIVFRPNNNLNNKWLYYFLKRNSFRVNGAKNMSGAVGHKRIDKSFIENTLIPIPSIKEQELIISKLESLFNHSKIINDTIIKKMNEIDYLKKSILTKFLNININLAA